MTRRRASIRHSAMRVPWGGGARCASAARKEALPIDPRTGA